PAAVDMCRELVGETAAKKLLTIPLSNDTVSHRIVDMLDESTDVSNAALLLVFVRYRWENSLHEDILFCGELPTRATAHECFRCMDEFFRENGLQWKNCVRAPEAKWTHCFLHRESLAAKKMSPELHKAMTISVKAINFIKNSAVNSRCFAKLCEDIEADHVQLLYHSEVRWLSRGLVLNRLYELKNEVCCFLKEKNPSCQHIFLRKITDLVSRHLSQLAGHFDEYFPEDPSDGHLWIVDPFSVDPTKNDVALPSELESQLLDVSTDSTFKVRYWDKLDLASFWIVVSKEYPSLALRAVKLLLPFTTTYLCESGFSIVTTTKTKARNRLSTTPEATLRLSLSPISGKQAQVSH
uniref:Uncharacterized protein n=1 Tax=Neogobius melanostomus TaxID=47308 RepID=A0A8C6T1B5_9GOBI